MIIAEGLHLSYRTGFFRTKVPVLKGITFQVESGGIIGYLGINGAGKTTTMKLLVGINRCHSGTISIEGHSPATVEGRRLIGYLPENPYFYEYLTPREALEFYARLYDMGRQERLRRADQLLERVALADAANRPVRGFSKGMRQRLGLAQALIHEPKYLLLDEPLTGLDPMGRWLLRDIIVEEREQGRTVFFSSHVLSDVEAIADHLCILNAGRIHFSGSLEELKSKFTSQGMLVRFAIDELANLKDIPWTVQPKRKGSVFEARLKASEKNQAFLAEMLRRGAKLVEVRIIGQALEDYFLDEFRSASRTDVNQSSEPGL